MKASFVFLLAILTMPSLLHAKCTEDEVRDLQDYIPKVKKRILEGDLGLYNMLKEEVASCDQGINDFIPLSEFTTLSREGMKNDMDWQVEQFKKSKEPWESLSYLENAEENAKALGLDDKVKEISELRKAAGLKKTAKERAARQSFNDSCKNNQFDLTEKLKLGPPRDQDTLGWCYSFAAADLLTAHLGEQISSFDLALGYNSESYRLGVRNAMNCAPSASQEGKTSAKSEGGYIEAAITAGSDTGFCREADLPGYVNGAARDLKDTYSILCDASKGVFSEDDLCTVHQFTKDYVKVAQQDFIKIIQTNLGNSDAVLTKLKDKSCKERIQTKVVPNNVNYPNRYYNVENEIQKALLEDRPVGISVRISDILTKPTDSGHAMVVVGQEFNNGRCEFVVRNSWGKSCGDIDRTKVTCDPSTGMLRIPVETLKKMTFGTTDIPK